MQKMRDAQTTSFAAMNEAESIVGGFTYAPGGKEPISRVLEPSKELAKKLGVLPGNVAKTKFLLGQDEQGRNIYDLTGES